MEATEASIQDMARLLAGPERICMPRDLEPAALEVELLVVDHELAAPNELEDPWFADDDAIVVTTTDDVYQLSRSNRLRSLYLAVALVTVACALA